MNNKKQKSPAKCQAQFNRTVKKTGKWRGKKANEYKTYHSIKKPKPCDHFLQRRIDKCIHCEFERKPNLYNYDKKF